MTGGLTGVGERAPQIVIGVDEVGRGCLFGPVVAAAVILPEAAVPTLLGAGLTDSKQLTAKQRDRLDLLIRSQATACHLGLASVAEIDRINILQASLRAMARAIAKVNLASWERVGAEGTSWANVGAIPVPCPILCLVDGNRRIPGLTLPQQTVVGGDSREPAIAAASVVAKVWRDRLMARLALRYPGYGLERHKGYGTALHRQELAKLGPSDQHRRSFRPCAVGDVASEVDQLALKL